MDDLEALRQETFAPSIEAAKTETDKPSYIQTDLFCEACGCNLKGQRVWRDERLELIICRCQECGRHAVPGVSTSAGHPWMARFSLSMMLIWIVFIVGLFIFGVLGIAKLQLAYLGIFTGEVPGVNGRETVFVLPAGTIAVRKIAEILIANLSLSLGLGAALSVFLWRVPRTWYLAGVVLPPLLAWGVLLLWRTQAIDAGLFQWGVNRLVYLSLLQSCAVGIGIIIGRPLARLLVQMLFVPQMLYYVEFLWTVDEKPFPARTAAEVNGKITV